MKCFCEILIKTSLLCLVLGMTVCQADSLLTRSVELAFAPKEAYFIVSEANNVKKIAVQSWADSDNRKYFASYYRGPVELNGKAVKVALIVRGINDECEIFPFRMQHINNEFETEAILEERLKQYSDKLASWRMQERVQKESLERLRNDADIIGNLGRIADKASLLQRVKMQIKNLDHDEKNLQEFLRTAAVVPQPRNFLRRQTSLNEQLAELVKAAKDVEASAMVRKNEGELGLQRDLQLIEDTREEDYAALLEELKTLRKRRLELEKSNQY